MDPVEEHSVECPYCGERLSLLIDCSELEQTYVEDCHVCCQPMLVTVSGDDDGIRVDVRQENE
jgi:hypothetical protein